MAQTNINIRIDAELKKQFDKFCSDIGMSMTTAFCVFAKKAVREQRIPFEITADEPLYSAANLAKLMQSLEQAKNREMVSKTIEELEEIENS